MAVTKSVYGYRKLSKHNASLIELCDAERPLPPHSYNTRGLWLDLPVQLRDALGARGHMFARGGLHAIEHAMIALAPLCVTCDPSELGCQCTRRQVSRARVLPHGSHIKPSFGAGGSEGRKVVACGV
eukprot:6259267-Prymnesium_polylepis.1